jgi:ribosomal protein S17E
VGRVKTKLITRVSNVLLEKYSEKFSNDFSSNKAAVIQLTDIKSKKLADQIAGHITHEKKTSQTT